MAGAVSSAAMARAHLALRRRRQMLSDVNAVDPGAIPDGMSFRAWCEKLGSEGLLIDRKPFRLDNRPALLPLYDAIPTTREEAAGWTLVSQKATQLGLTVWETLADIYMAKKWAPVNIGLYLADQATASFKSHHRFMPIVRSSPLLYRELLRRPAGEPRGGEGNVMTRQFGSSLLMFMWTSGKLSTESRPMDVVSLDEVQGMSLDAIDKVRARTGDSDVRFSLLLSTANMPDADINNWYQRGTQEVWHTRCLHCGAMSDLSDPNGIFPAKSITYNTGQLRGAPGHNGGPPLDQHVWTCPECGGWIPDPQVGEYICMNPAGWGDKIRSFLQPRTISPRITPGEMLRDHRNARTGDQKKSFFNRTLARPYVDLDQLPVTLDHCEAAATEGKRAGLIWETQASPGASYYMGIDQMGGFNAVIIKKRMADGRAGVVYAAAIFGDEPFDECALLMDRFRISVCVTEQLLNANSARRFTNRFPGRVYMNTSFVAKEMLDWDDLADRNDRKTAEEARERYTLGVNQYKLMQWALFRIRDRQTLFPDPDALPLAEVPGGPNGKKHVNLVREWVFDHFTKTALVVEQDEKTRKPKAFVFKAGGIDPHFSYANMLCDAAWAREHGSGSIFIPTAPAAPVGPVDAVPLSLPSGVAVTIPRPVDVTPRGSCGGCTAFNAARGWCNERKMLTTAREHACVMYEGIE